MQTVYLEGNLAKFGHKWETSCDTIADVFKLIECQTPGLRKHLVDAHEAGIEYQVKRGKELIDIEECFLTLHDDDIIITELPAGSKGIGKVLAAIAIVVIIGLTGPAGFLANIGAAFAGTAGFASFAALFAVNLAMMGISEMMMPDPSVDGIDENRNYLFSGPANVATQGQAVPLAYGELIVGGAPISLSYSRTPITVDGGEIGGTTGTSPTVTEKEKVNTPGSDRTNQRPVMNSSPPIIDRTDLVYSDDEMQSREAFVGFA